VQFRGFTSAPKSSLSIRKWATGHFRIAYLVKGDGNVEILGVFHGSLDIAKYQL